MHTHVLEYDTASRPEMNDRRQAAINLGIGERDDEEGRERQRGGGEEGEEGGTPRSTFEQIYACNVTTTRCNEPLSNSF